MIKIYEGNSIKCSNIYNRYLRIIDPYHLGYIPRIGSNHRKRKFNELNKGINTPIRLRHRMSQIIPNKYNITLEFRISDSNLLNKLKEMGNNEFLLDRYIVEWNSKKYFLKRYNAVVYKIEGDIVVIFSKMYDIINEIKIDREIKLNLLLNEKTLK